MRVRKLSETSNTAKSVHVHSLARESPVEESRLSPWLEMQRRHQKERRMKRSPMAG